MEVYQVGGAVRDGLLGLPVKDADWVVVGATPEDMRRHGFRQVGKDFPVFLHPETSEEYALARTERKVAAGYHGFLFDTDPGVTLEDDLRRRDLTINAMARDEQGRLIDPYGGRRDLEHRVLRHVSEAFVEDPVRVLRVARFAARLAPLGFTVAEATLTLMRRMAAGGELDALVAERVWQETVQALGTAEPQVFFETLRLCGALAVTFPEIEALFGVPQPADSHPEIDTGVHTMMVLRQAARLTPAAETRFAALCHDLGKGRTPRASWPQHVGHEKAGVRLILTLCERLRAPRAFRDLATLAARLHGLAHRALELRPGTLLKLIEQADGLRRPARFEAFLSACEADARGRTERELHPYPQAARLRAARDAAASADLSAATGAGLSGERLQQAVRRLRVQAIASAVNR